MTLISIILTAIQPIEIGGIVFGGVIVLGFVWEKIRPIIIIKTDKDVKFYYGISHSKKRKNMKKLNQNGINGITVEADACYDLCNKPSEIIKEIGTVSMEKAEEIINETDNKKIERKEKRTKK